MKLLRSCTRAASRARRRGEAFSCLSEAIAARCSAAVWCSSSLRVHARACTLRSCASAWATTTYPGARRSARRAPRASPAPSAAGRATPPPPAAPPFCTPPGCIIVAAAGRAVDARDTTSIRRISRVLPLGRRRVRLEPARDAVPRPRARRRAMQDVGRRVACQKLAAARGARPKGGRATGR